MAVKIKVNMKPVNTIITRLGVGATGDVQMQATRIVNQRITRYMPFRTGNLATKTKFMGTKPRSTGEENGEHMIYKKSIKSPTEIEVAGPYAAYQYYGKVMVGRQPKVATDKDLQYDKGKHPLAGPKWDQRMMAAEGKQIAAEIQEYVDKKAGKR